MEKIDFASYIPDPMEADDPRLVEYNKQKEQEEIHRIAEKAQFPDRFYRLLLDGGVKDNNITKVVEWLISEGDQMLLLHGSPGTGKTCAACKSIMDKGYGKYITSYDYCNMVTSYNSGDKHKVTLIRETSLLVLDDVGVESDKHHQHIEHLLNIRYDTTDITIVTTNLDGKQFREAYGARVSSRLGEIGRTVKCVDVLRKKKEAIEVECNA